MICFCYFYQKNCFFVLGLVHNDPFSIQIGSKKTIFLRFYQLFFRTVGIQHKLLILIVSSNIFHWKSVKESKMGVVFGAKFGPNQVQCCEKNKGADISMGFFHILHDVYFYKQKCKGYRKTRVKIEDYINQKHNI